MPQKIVKCNIIITRTQVKDCPANIYLFKVDNRNTEKKVKIARS